MTVQQLTLPITLEKHLTYDSFYCQNTYMHGLLQQLKHTESKAINLIGESGTGKTHLLQAACHQSQRCWLYLNCHHLANSHASILENLENQLICLDNIEYIKGKKEWETACYKLLLSNSNRLLISSQVAHIQLARADLESRIQSFTTFKTVRLTEETQQYALLLRAKKMGMTLSVDLTRWMQKNLPRDNHSLFKFIEELGNNSILEQKKPSILLAKKTLEQFKYA